MSRTTERIVRCPCCRGPATYGHANPWRPFCSERCRTMDLGAWASERLRLPADNPPDPGETDGAGEAARTGWPRH